MDATPVFFNRIDALKRLVMIRTLYQILLIALLLFLCAYTIATGVEKVFGRDLRGEVLFYVIAGIIAFIGSLAYAGITKKRFIEILVGIDSRLNLKDRISTAYEYHRYGKTSQFKEALIEDAGRALSGFDADQLLPGTWSWVHLALIALIVINAGLVFVRPFEPGLRSATLTPADAETIRTRLQEQLVPPPEETGRAAEESRETAYESLRQLLEQLDQPTMTQGELLNSLNDLIQQVQQEQARLAEEISSQLQEFEETADQQLQSLDQFSARDLKNARQMLNQKFKDRIPDTLDRNFAILERQQNLEDALQELENEILMKGNARRSERQEEGQAPPQEGDQAGERKEPVERPESTETSSQFRQEGDEMSDQSGSGTFPEPENGSERESGSEAQPPDEQGAPASGIGKTGGEMEELSGDTPESSRGPLIQDKTLPVAEDEFKTRIRAVTTTGAATLTEEEVVRTYQREVESVLQNEEIPLNYRAYIKNYFLSIGLEPRSPEDTKEKDD